jgi:hypothetical protein
MTSLCEYKNKSRGLITGYDTLIMNISGSKFAFGNKR